MHAKNINFILNFYFLFLIKRGKKIPPPFLPKKIKNKYFLWLQKSYPYNFNNWRKENGINKYRINFA